MSNFQREAIKAGDSERILSEFAGQLLSGEIEEFNVTSIRPPRASIVNRSGSNRSYLAEF